MIAGKSTAATWGCLLGSSAALERAMSYSGKGS